MGDQLLIRSYWVGCGDCIYVRIPEGPDGFHILIDCGKKGGTEQLKDAIKDISDNLLPTGSKPGKKRLDLIVATHRHEDHIKGFDPEWFKDIEVKNIWLSAVMDPQHPQAKGVRQLHDLADQTMSSLTEHSKALDPQIALLAALYGVSNDRAVDLLREDLPKANQIKPKFVTSGMSNEDLGIKLKSAKIHVLAPEKDIDHYYLGEDEDKTLKGFSAASDVYREKAKVATNAVPANISEADFRLLRSGMLSNGLAFAAKDSSIQNNMSVVLLIEWKKRRLLFVGDAEWEGEYSKGKKNGSWNVMWEKHRDKLLKAPLDFLKVGHHGSHNATPPRSPEKVTAGGDRNDTAAATSVFEILDTLLPVPKNGKRPTAQAIVSTEREFYTPIPDCSLLVDLGRRVCNTRNYAESLAENQIDIPRIWDTTKGKRDQFYERFEKKYLDQPQALRTDLEFELTKQIFIEVEIEPK